MKMDFNRDGAELVKRLSLATSPVAIKALRAESEIPPGALRPRRDRYWHLAQCQAFALSRRNQETVAMLKEDNWCLAPLIAYGQVHKMQEPLTHAPDYDCFDYGKYIGILSAPLESAEFTPDVVIIFGDTNQLRHLMMALRNNERQYVGGNYFPPSCAHAVVSPMLTGQYRVILPDPGEYVRALTQAGEMMFALPGTKLGLLVEDLKKYQETSIFAHDRMFIRPDFPQPDIYKQCFKAWGMDYEQ
jgi:uncharacterized protein (DUF169 family)